MKSNYEFLKAYWPALSEIGKTAESYLYSDPNSCIYRLGLFGELVVKEIFAAWQLPLPGNDDTQAGRIRVLKRERLLPPNMDDILYAQRKWRNDAVYAGLHSFYNSNVEYGRDVDVQKIKSNLSLKKEKKYEGNSYRLKEDKGA